MMQSEMSRLSWQCFDEFESSFTENSVHTNYSDFSPFTLTNDPFDVLSEELMGFPFDEWQDEVQAVYFPRNLEPFDPVLNCEVVDIWEYLEGSEQSSPSMESNDTSMEITSFQSQPSIFVPTEDTQIHTQILVRAYKEAMEEEQTELADVIMKRISEKVSPIGETEERISYHLFQQSSQEFDYLKQEAMKNFNAAFKVIYQNNPHGKFAHLRANAAILEAMPCDSDVIHIVDFDMEDGLQWSMVIEAIGQQSRLSFQPKLLKITSIKCKDEDNVSTAALPWRFEETKKYLYDHAESFGLNLKVDEMEIQDLVTEIKISKKRKRSNEWFAFNCMVGLPHMGRVKSTTQAMNFLTTASYLLQRSDSCNTNNRGIITFGEGNPLVEHKKSSNFESFFDGYVSYYTSMLESIEWRFSKHHAEARTAIESLFIAPFVSHNVLSQKWTEMKKGYDTEPGKGMMGWGVSEESFLEAQEMVREESMYTVRVEGESSNRLVLGWRGTPLVRVSTWV